MASIDLVYPQAMEQYNGIADHTRRLSLALAARGHDVRMVGAGPRAGGPRVGYVDGWPEGNLRSTSSLRHAIAERSPDLVVVQFEQFSYGSRGYNPEFSHVLGQLRSGLPHVRSCLFVHETYPMPTSPKRAAMWLYQRRQLRRLARSADRTLVTCDAWRGRLGVEMGEDRVCGAPPNVAPSSGTRAAARKSLRFGEELVVAVFGHLDPRRCADLRVALAQPELAAATVAYVGKDRQVGDKLAVPVERRLRTFFDAPEGVASDVFRAADVALSPFADGASARRGSLNTLLASGLPTVTTIGRNTDGIYLELAQGGALALRPRGTEFARAAAQLAASEQDRIQMRTALAERVGLVPSWERAVRAIEAALPR